jgi:PKD repeat protein
MPVKRFLMLALICCGGLCAQTITDANFTIDNLTYPGYGTIGLDFDSAGRLFIGEKRGRVLVMTPNGSGGFNAPTVFADLTAFVDWSQESGLLGLAIDPDFANNRYIYVFYTTPTDQRLVRIQADNTFIVWTAAQTVLLQGLPRTATYHKAGDIDFHPNDPNSIYIALGDDGQIGLAEQLDYYEGKILRVNKTNGEGLTTNPFYAGSTVSIRSRIWSIGYRNPFRFAFHPTNTADVLYTSENGGPTGMTTNQQDRICWNEVGTSGNWNWTAYNAGDSSAFFNPVNPGGQDCIVMGRDRSSHIGIDIASGGVFADPTDPTSSTIVVSNWLTGGFIRRWRLTGANMDGMTAMAADGGNAFVTGLFATDLKFGPDGWLYFTQSNGDESIGGWYRVGRIRRVTGQPPVASFTTNPTPAQGNAPLNVQFTDASTDDGTIVSWGWDFGDGSVSSAPSPSHNYTTAGSYTAILTVQDNLGLTDSHQVNVDVFQTTALTLTGQVFDGRNLPATGLGVATELRLYQGDGTTPIAFAGGIGAAGNGIAVPTGGMFNTIINVPIAGSSMVVSAGEPAGDGVHAQFVGFLVPSSPHTENLAFYLSDTAFWGLVTDTGGNPASVDIGVARNSPNALYAFAGARDYLAASGIPASGVNHRTTSDALGYYYIPLLAGTHSANFYFDAVADTGSATYVSQIWIEWGFANAATQRDISLGLLAGGAGADDLTGIAVTPNVDYMTQIQPIWNAQCAGCHAVGGGSAGLVLGGSSSRLNIVNVPSTQVGGLMLVLPGDASQSYLFQKINQTQPQVGIRMRPGSAMSLAQQALVRDWINQGALASAGGGGGGSGSSGGDDGGGGGCAVTDTSSIAWLIVAIVLALGTIALQSSRRKLGA